MAMNDDVGKVLRAALIANQAQGERETDYRDPDGLLVCGICGEPREFVAPAPINARVYIRCRCDRERAEAEEAAVRQQMLERRRDKCFAAMPLMRRCSFAIDDEPMRRESIMCRRYAENLLQMGGMGLLLYGGVGTGKTFLAAAMCNAVIDRYFRARMTSIPALVNEMRRESFSESGSTLAELTEDLVVIDDFGVERETDYMVEQTYKLIEARIESGKPMVVTTNLNPKDFKSQNIQKQRIYDRILAVCRPVPVTGESRRAAARGDKWSEMDRVLGV